MYSFGRDFDEGLEIDNIFREYIEQKNNKGFLDRAEALSGDNLDVQKRVFEAVSLKLMPFAEAAVNGIEAAGFWIWITLRMKGLYLRLQMMHATQRLDFIVSLMNIRN